MKRLSPNPLFTDCRMLLDFCSVSFWRDHRRLPFLFLAETRVTRFMDPARMCQSVKSCPTAGCSSIQAALGRNKVPQLPTIVLTLLFLKKGGGERGPTELRRCIYPLWKVW